MIFSTVTRYVEQVGRRIIQQRRGALDSVETVFNGPTETELLNTPAWGQPLLPDFPFMYCETANVARREAGISEIHATYVGKIRSQTDVISTPPIITPSWHEQELSWTNNENSLGHVGSYPAAAPPYHSVTRTCRYTGKAVTFKYLTNVRVPAVGQFAGPAAGYLGIENQVTEISGIADATAGVAMRLINVLAFTNDQINQSIDDQDNGWYLVSEVYMTRGRINSTLLPYIGGSAY